VSLLLDQTDAVRAVVDAHPEWWQSPEYLDTVYAIAPQVDALHVGNTEPRLGTVPLRVLTPETSLGFEVIEFAEEILGVTLYPWQRALLIRALELLSNGEYRFRRVMVLVARQQGKTTVASVLAAWWLFVESARRPDRVPPMKFKVVGVAQTLDIAREPWDVVKLWCDPKPETDEDRELAIEALQDATAKVTDTNGKERITARSRAHYEIRAAKNARGKPAARVLMDELREQRDWSGWNAVSQTSKSFWNGMLIGFSNAGDATAVVLLQQRTAGLDDLKSWEQYVDSGMQSIEEYANNHDTSLGLLEWSAPDGCDKDDVNGILAANPSIGYGSMTVASALADIRSMTDAGYRTEVLCQWVLSRVDPFLQGDEWSKSADAPSVDADGNVVVAGSAIAADSRMVMGIDVMTSKRTTSSVIGVAGYRPDGRVHLELIAQRTGMSWVVKHAKAVRAKTGITQVALQTKGCAAADLIDDLTEAGFDIVSISGTVLLNSADRLNKRIRADKIRHRSQGPLNLAVANGTTKDLSGMPVWDRFGAPVDISPVIAVTNALVALESFPPPKKKKPAPPPPAARIVARVVTTPSGWGDLAVT
jgi:phage terminase large subunit-like protein